MKNLNNNTATMPTAATPTQAATFTNNQRHQLHRYNELTSEFFGLMGSSNVFSELLELYKYMEESNLIDAGSPQADSEIKMNYLFTIQKLGAFVADMERNHFFFKSK